MAYYPSPPDKDPEQHSILNSSRARLAVLCVSVLLIVTGAAMLIRYGVELAASRQTTQELREAADVDGAGADDRVLGAHVSVADA